MPSCKGAMCFNLRLSTLLVLTFVLIGDFVCSGFEGPVTFTNAASELHPRQVDPTSYWIGSHTLDFTPNPFLKDRGIRLNSVESSVVANVLASPSSSTTELPRRRGRKLKRKRGNAIINSKIANQNRRGRKSQPIDKDKTVQDSNISGNPKRRSRRLGRRKNFFHLREGGSKTFTSSPLNAAKITTPDPIIPDLDPRSSQISRSFASVHPENLNPSYFRNIILNAMMDRLVGVNSAIPSVLAKTV